MIATIVACALALAGLQTAAAPAAPEEKGEIRGRVTDGPTGLPLARAVVYLSGPGQGAPAVVATDDRGGFRFAGLAPGRYHGSVMPGAFKATHSMQVFKNAEGRPETLVLKKDEVRVVNVALPRTLAVNVRVVDAWGQPLSQIPVSVRPAETQSSGMYPLMNRQRTTDDNGRLRIFGIEPGRYVLCAEPNQLGGSGGARNTSRRERLLRTCYPNAASEAEAEPVRVERSDTAELELKMRHGRTFTISGRILDASGAPAGGTFAGLNQYYANGSSGSGVRVDADGRFRIDNVHPGTYSVHVTVGGPDRPEQRRDFEAALLPVAVTDADVEDLLLVLKKGVDVAGRIRTEDPAATLPPAEGSGLMVTTRLADDRLPGSGSTEHAYAARDRTFTIKGSFGRRVVDVLNVPRGWFVKSIRYGTTEIIDEAIEFKETRGDAPVLDIVLSNRGAVVTGHVADDAGNPVPGALVLMLSKRPNGTRPISSTTATAAGTFKLDPARPGDYTIVALPRGSRYPQAGEWNRLARLAAQGERVTLGDLDERMVDLQVVITDR